MVEFLVVVYLTFLDGSIAAHNDGKWEVANSLEDCMKREVTIIEEMKEQFKDHNPKPSTFIKLCTKKNQ